MPPAGPRRAMRAVCELALLEAAAAVTAIPAAALHASAAPVTTNAAPAAITSRITPDPSPTSHAAPQPPAGLLVLWPPLWLQGPTPLAAPTVSLSAVATGAAARGAAPRRGYWRRCWRRCWRWCGRG